MVFEVVPYSKVRESHDIAVRCMRDLELLVKLDQLATNPEEVECLAADLAAILP